MTNNMIPGKDFIGVGCGVLIINDKNETLLLKRNGKCRNEAGTWSRPGGTVEFGETIEETLKREIKEELNVELELIRFLDISDHIIKNENQHWVAISYLGKIKSGALKNMEPEKHDEIQWFDLNELPDNLYSPTKESIDKFKKNQ